MKTKKLVNNTVAAVFITLFTFSCNQQNGGNDHLLNKAPLELDTSADAKFLLAGTSTIFDDTSDAFTHASPKLSFENKAKFFVGKSLFDQNWLLAPSATIERDGLGPFFNAQSCASCHFKNGRGRPPKEGEKLESLLIRA